MIRTIKTYFPSVVNQGVSLEDKFTESAYGTLSINDQPPIPVPTETLKLIQEQIRLAIKND